MPRLLNARDLEYEIIDRFSAAPWNGSPTTLSPSQGVNMPQTTTGSMVLAWVNQTKNNNLGTLSVTSGGSAPVFLNAPALEGRPCILTTNWDGDNLSVTNISAADKTPIWVAANGPGIPGYGPPQNLPSNGNPVQLSTLAAAQGVTQPRWMQLNFANGAGSLSIVAIIGGPLDASGNNAYIISLNDAYNSGPGTGVAPPQGYYATTSATNYSFQFNWGGASVFVASMSPVTSLNVTVSLNPL